MKILQRRPAFTLIELLVVIAIISLLMALLLPAIQKVRAAADKMICGSNMRQLVIALHHYHNDHNKFPLGYTDPTSSEAWHNWMAYTLPYVEGQNLAKDYNTSFPWWVGTNRDIVIKRIKLVQCPSTPNPERIQDKPETTPPNKTGSCGDYFAVAGVNVEINNSLPSTQQFNINTDLRGVLCWFDASLNKVNRIADVRDGTANTFMIGECAGREDVYRGRMFYPVNFTSSPRVRARGGAWATTDNAYMIGSRKAWDVAFGPIPGEMKINNSNEWGHCFYSFHPTGANFAFADGSVRFFGESTSLWTLAALSTRAGGEVIITDE